MKPLFAVVLLGCLIVGCAEQPVPPAARSAASADPHRLAWEGYDGSGDPAMADYVLDGEHIGIGPAGLGMLRQRIAAMPRGARVAVIPYYGDPGGAVRRSHPFNIRELHEFAASHGVELMVPNGG